MTEYGTPQWMIEHFRYFAGSYEAVTVTPEQFERWASHIERWNPRSPAVTSENDKTTE